MSCSEIYYFFIIDVHLHVLISEKNEDDDDDDDDDDDEVPRVYGTPQKRLNLIDA